jgi:hypothetical protein
LIYDFFFAETKSRSRSLPQIHLYIPTSMTILVDHGIRHPTVHGTVKLDGEATDMAKAPEPDRTDKDIPIHMEKEMDMAMVT